MMKQKQMEYKDYIRLQVDYNKKKINNCWVQESTIAKIREVINVSSPRILCHGTRRGVEQQLFRKYFPDCDVLGTEISETASDYPDTIQWDFHKIKREWKNSFDIIYSNSLDHALYPKKALRRWIACLKQTGRLFIEWCGDNERAVGPDILGATSKEIINIANDRKVGGQVVDIIPLVPKKEKYRYQELIVVKKWEYPELTNEQLEEKVAVLTEAKDIIEFLGIEYYLGGSTLLGMMQSRDIIRFGSGMTIHFRSEEYLKYIDKLIKRLKDSGFKVTEQQKDKKNDKVKIVKNGYLIELVAWFKGRDKESLYRIRRNYKLPREIFQPGLSLPLRDKMFQVFNPPEEYCFFRFTDWKTPGLNSRNRESFENERYNRR